MHLILGKRCGRLLGALFWWWNISLIYPPLSLLFHRLSPPHPQNGEDCNVSCIFSFLSISSWTEFDNIPSRHGQPARHHPDQGRERRAALLHQPPASHAGSRQVERGSQHARFHTAGIIYAHITLLYDLLITNSASDLIFSVGQGSRHRPQPALLPRQGPHRGQVRGRREVGGRPHKVES